MKELPPNLSDMPQVQLELEKAKLETQAELEIAKMQPPLAHSRAHGAEA